MREWLPRRFRAIRRAFAIIYVERPGLHRAVRIEAQYGQFTAIRELVEFIRTSKRGICGAGHYHARVPEDAAAILLHARVPRGDMIGYATPRHATGPSPHIGRAGPAATPRGGS